MISIKSEREINLIKEAGKIIHDLREYLKPFIKEGTTTIELDRLSEEFIRSRGGVPTCKGFEDFPCSICTSINEEVVHGIPSKRKLRNGDIITIDVVVSYKGYNADSAWTYAVGDVSSEKERLLRETKECLFRGISMVKPGNRIGDISHAIELLANKYHLGIVRELVGHGIGTSMHEEPDIPNYGEAGVGPVLKEGMVLAIEPMLTLGRRDICILDDDWTIETVDNSPSAHYEHTVVVTKDGCEILTGGIDG